MTRDRALEVWAGLIDASPHGCRVHLTGGEVFLRFEFLLDLCRAARRAGLGPLEAIETNGGWATNEAEIRRRLAALDETGMGHLRISADPYHQQFVPIERPRRLARVAAEVLGAERVRVRWWPWLTDGYDLGGLPVGRRAEILARYAAGGADRLTGRAADGLDGQMQLRPAAAFDDNPCNEMLLRGRHVHVAPEGSVWPATCIGIVVGNALRRPVGTIWRDLAADKGAGSLVGTLCERGPVGLMELAFEKGFADRRAGWASKCQLCFHLRRHLAAATAAPDVLGPPWIYDVEPRETAEQKS
ncbi:MAG: hypothetical protein ACOC95_05260 [Planctomycetota bacterium]